MIAFRLAALVVPLVLTLLAGRWLVRRVVYARPARPLPSLDHTETALLRSTDAPVLTAFAVLRSAGVIDSTDRHTVFAAGPPPSGASAVDDAVHAAVARGASWPEVRHDRAVQRAVAKAEGTVRGAGLLAGLVSRKLIALIAIGTVLVTVAEFTVLLYLTQVPLLDMDPIPIWGGAVLTGGGIPFLIVAGLLLAHTARASRAGRNLLRATERRHPMARVVEPGRWLAAPTAVGMAAAVHGLAVIWMADPRFARQAGLPEVARSDGDGGDGDGGGDGHGDGDGGDGD